MDKVAGLGHSCSAFLYAERPSTDIVQPPNNAFRVRERGATHGRRAQDVAPITLE